MATRVKKPKPEPALIAGVRVTNPDRVVFAIDQATFTKGDVARYVERIAPLMLPHVRGRPMSVVRCPGGSAGAGFFQKHVIPGMPEAIGAMDVMERGGIKPSLVVHDAAGLVGLVQMSALEFHTWCSVEDDSEHADRFIIDLDPGTDLPWSRVAEAARDVRARLERDGLRAFVKTTGGKGLHVIAPLQPTSWHALMTYAEQFATKMGEAAPDKYTLNMKKTLRVGRIFIDYVRNMRGSTIVAPWSTRKNGGTIAVPISWDELDDVRGSTWNLSNVDARVTRGDEAWRDYFTVKQRLPK